jgi:hypothetical protein
MIVQRLEPALINAELQFRIAKSHKNGCVAFSNSAIDIKQKMYHTPLHCHIFFSQANR